METFSFVKKNVEITQKDLINMKEEMKASDLRLRTSKELIWIKH